MIVVMIGRLMRERYLSASLDAVLISSSLRSRDSLEKVGNNNTITEDPRSPKKVSSDKDEL
jgi:phosphohistidine phosphatase SixA